MHALMSRDLIGIAGAGLIDGRGRELLAVSPKGKSVRPFLARFVRCEGVSVSDARLQGSAAWTMHFSQCTAVRARHLAINKIGRAVV